MTSNPLLRPEVISNVYEEYKPMTVQGAVNKTLLFLAIVVFAGYFTWNMCAQGFSDKVSLITMLSAIMGLVLVIVASFKPHLSKVLGSTYAICEGLVLGGVSYIFEASYSGIVLQAVGITLISLLSMLLLYKLKIIEATEKFKKTIIVSTLAIAIYYLVAIVMGFFGHPVTVFNGGLIGIGISVVFCIVACLNFILDFDFIERGSKSGAPDFYEWYGALGLLVTIVWLYLEVLKLLAQLNKRN